MLVSGNSHYKPAALLWLMLFLNMFAVGPASVVCCFAHLRLSPVKSSLAVRGCLHCTVSIMLPAWAASKCLCCCCESSHQLGLSCCQPVLPKSPHCPLANLHCGAKATLSAVHLHVVACCPGLPATTGVRHAGSAQLC